MDAKYNRISGKTILTFTPREGAQISVLLQLVIEEERKKDTHVPDFSRIFFTNLATTKKKFDIEFNFEYLEFVIVFLEAVLMEMEDNGTSTVVVRNFIEHIEKFCSKGKSIQ